MVKTLQTIYGKRIIIMGGGAQVGQVAIGAVSEADRHNIRGEHISVDTIPLVGEQKLADAVRGVARLPRAKALVLAGSLMGGDIETAVREVRAAGAHGHQPEHGRQRARCGRPGGDRPRAGRRDGGHGGRGYRQVHSGTIEAPRFLAAYILRAERGHAAMSWKLGICSYSFTNKTTLAQAIQGRRSSGVRAINIKPEFHLPYASTPAEIAAARKMLDDAGLQLAGTGTTYLTKMDEGEIRQRFEFNKALGSPLIVIGPTAETLPLIEKYVKEYNIKVAIHNHGPSDKHFPTPASALKVIGAMDRRVGLCMDVGHTMRSGVDPVAAAARGRAAAPGPARQGPAQAGRTEVGRRWTWETATSRSSRSSGSFRKWDTPVIATWSTR